ncbi:non-ribosomal peptide synthetase [Lihuaxuella thermophila]|uniref:Amino acid adenylation domain-containing protein n=1 Tax=Lihuaxuella thermophila TaxID=1173111 RepID=A0A1H8C673_9BACL|nr:non-ribosomal peptide synthetase [Lihuaxuella thermophila]SEM89758.1 amino acid adenylation domain-containing protein [Lihuaxuella thermophila]
MSKLHERLSSLSAEKRALIEKLLKQKQESQAKAGIPVQSRDSLSFPLSFTQQRLWILNQLEPGNPFYNVPSVFRLKGSLDMDALKRTLNEMVRRHEVLRTTFAENEEGQPVQRISPSQQMEMRVMDLRNLDAEKREVEKERLIQEEALYSFNLSEGPLFRALLLHLEDDEYLFMVTMHHTVFDGWSLSVFVREMCALYEAFCQGEASPLPLPNVQYADYACWQRERLQGELVEKQLQYWKSKLGGALPVLELPTDRPRPAVQTFKGTYHSILLPVDLYEELKEFSRREGVTLFMTLLAAFKVLLFRYTGLEDIIVGSPTTGREMQELEGLIGPCVNTLALRSDLSGNPTFRDLLAQVRDTSLGAFENQDLPFDRLVEVLQPERNLRYSPVFQVMFTLQNSLPAIQMPGLSMEFVPIDCGTAKYEISLDVFEGPEGPTCIFEYNTDLFDKDRIERMASHYQTLLEAIVASPEQRISELPLLTETEKHQLLHQWNRRSLQHGSDDCMHQLFEKQAQQTPEAVAVSFEAKHLTYRQLNERANQLARRLRSLGVGPETIVGICAERSLDMVVGTLAILKAGGAYLPMDPSYPKDRLQYMMEDAGAEILVTQQMLNGVVPDGVNAVVYLDDPTLDLENRENLTPLTHPDHLAYVIYTSGSTGKPKGTMITHRSWVNAFHGYDQAYGLREHCTAHLQMASISFDVYAGDLVRSLLSGAKLVLCRKEILFDAPELYRLMAEEKVDCAEFVPAVMRNLVEYLEETNQTLDFMRVIVVSSDVWYVHEYRRFQRVCGPKTRLINAYGVTEATIDSTYYDGSMESFADNDIVPIGQPLANVSVYILDSHLQPVPAGIPGELCIGGAGVARGYLNRPELNAEKFLDHPFVPGERLYRTGDLACFMPDGNIKLLGRIDHQVKIRGLRIELGEIETVLGEHPEIRENVVIAREDKPGDLRLVAYLVTHQQKELPFEELRMYLKGKLPDHMVPSAFVHLDALPLNNSGKVDRRALPAPDWEELGSKSNFVGPRTATEEMLCDIWGQAFGLRRVSIFDDFFALGGHSLLAIQIISQIKKVFQVDLSLKTLFETPTVAELATVIHGYRGEQKEYEDFLNSLPQVEPDRENLYEPFPLTDVQEAYWIGRSGEFELGNVSTHNYDELEFENLDMERFDQAWQKLIKRHDMLRAVVDSDGKQRILKEVPHYDIKVTDLRGKSQEEIDFSIEAIRQEMSHQILDTSRWPVFDLRVTLLDGNKARIHFSTDSLTFDAWSFVVLIKELVQLHENIDTELPELEFSFRDYVLAERSLHGSEPYRQSQKYWQNIIPSLPPAPELPLVKSSSSVTRPQFKRLHASLEPDVWRKLKGKATRRGMTATGVLLAAYAEVLTAWSKSPHFTLNLTFLNRHPFHPQVNDIVGEFTSLTLLEVDNSSQEPFEVRARKIQERLWSDLEHHYVSGIQVLRELKRIQGGVTSAKMPIVFTSALTLPIPDQEDSPISLRPIHSITQTSQVSLDCGVWEDSGTLYCNWDVVEEIYPDGMLQDMFDAYFRLLRRLAEDESLWSETVIPLIPESQLEKQKEVNETKGPVSTGMLHTLFTKQASQRVDQPAVVTSGRMLTYGEMDRLSNQVGHLLREQGAQPNKLVGVFMEKGWEQVVAVLGILKSGAAYLPIDPELPQERVTYLLEHGEVSLVLTQSWVAEKVDWPSHIKRWNLDGDELRHFSTEPLSSVQNPGDLAYVIFTSGSTGLPKGVMIDHTGAVNTINDINSRFDIDSNDRVFALSALNFDLSVYDIFGTLAAGGTIVIPDADSRKDPAHWMDLMEREKVTVWNSVPALMGMLTEFAEGRQERLPGSLRLVLLSGDWIPLNLPNKIRSLSNDVQVISLGGATEASIWSIIYPIEAVDPAWQSIPYGKPMVNQTFHVLNDALEPCPIWVTGQLYIGGIGLAKGYWKDEEKTRSSFIIHPKTGERLYRTGDLGRYLPDGNIEFLGREDFQVKVQGYRIELGEIESVLTQHPCIAEAVVTAVGEQKGNKKLAAYVVCREGMQADPDELRGFLLQKLPEYMVPKYYMELVALPLTPNGKIDRKSLPKIEAMEEEIKQSFVPPRNEVEQKMADIWAELLEIEKVGVTDNFFELGGDSMLSVRVVNRLRQEFQVELPLRKIFETPDIARLAEYITKKLNVLKI